MVAGPLVGGFITDHLSWRWAFYVNLPLGGIALLVLITTMHLPKYRTEHRIDWLGAGLLSVGITAIVLITTWGGNEYDWTLAADPRPGRAGVRRAGRRSAWWNAGSPEPILPLALFANRNFALISLIGFLLGFAMFGAMNFLPLYQQTVQGASATNSGLLLLPLMFGMLVVSLVIGRAITRTGKYRAYPIIGGVVMTAGMALLSMLDVDTSKLKSSLVHGRARRRHGLPHADLHADRAEQRGAEGPRRGQRRGDLLPVDRRLVRHLAVRRDLRQPAGQLRGRPGLRRRRRRRDGPGEAQGAARSGPRAGARRSLRRRSRTSSSGRCCSPS